MDNTHSLKCHQNEVQCAKFTKTATNNGTKLVFTQILRNNAADISESISILILHHLKMSEDLVVNIIMELVTKYTFSDIF